MQTKHQTEEVPAGKPEALITPQSLDLSAVTDVQVNQLERTRHEAGCSVNDRREGRIQ
jgi:hypothetical protein